jgi:preprotein translocase subunit SecE
VSKELIKILIWVAVIGAAFAFFWWKGHLARFATYVQLTREELRKCTWPTWAELKGSTVVVAIAILGLGLFTVVVDWVFSQLVLLFT